MARPTSLKFGIGNAPVNLNWQRIWRNQPCNGRSLARSVILLTKQIAGGTNCSRRRKLVNG